MINIGTPNLKAFSQIKYTGIILPSFSSYFDVLTLPFVKTPTHTITENKEYQQIFRISELEAAKDKQIKAFVKQFQVPCS